jgi:hypothetical protein
LQCLLLLYQLQVLLCLLRVLLCLLPELSQLPVLLRYRML